MNESNILKALACISIARDIIINENKKNENVNHEEIIDNLSRAAVTTASLTVPQDARASSINSVLSSFGMDDLKVGKDSVE